MHVPDGFFNSTTSLGAGVVSAGTLAVSVRRATDELSDRLTPLAGLVAAFVFALQTLNFPVASGTSGHLLGAVLAAVLVGPYVGCVCIAVVLLVQALLFADGGLSAYGINVLLMGIIPSFAGYGLFWCVRRVLPSTRRAVVSASAIAAFVTVPLAAAAFSVLFVLGGSVDLSFGTVFAAMVGVHVLIGIGEALITGSIVSAVVSVRPDLVRGASHLAPVALRPHPVPEPVA
ncbi:MAG TPA: energy-coupling factor ABC transporter permease [Acidimicrobiales bacterium]|jgi:cobalt/nickel transport system permease protein|nr:energy-coupling factor ABC transporter permease [Acidimicrobiales bacterium]